MGQVRSWHYLPKLWMHVKLWNKIFKVIPSWEKTLKWVKHEVDMAYQSKKYMGNYETSFLTMISRLAKTLKWVKQKQLFWSFLFDIAYQSHEYMWKLWEKYFKMISSWAKSLKWLKHKQLFQLFLVFLVCTTYQSHAFYQSHKCI